MGVRRKKLVWKIRSNLPPLNFTEMGIPIGAHLVFLRDTGRTVVQVTQDRKVLYNKEEMSLTAATKQILNYQGEIYPTPLWLYIKKTLAEIYEETYPDIKDNQK